MGNLAADDRLALLGALFRLKTKDHQFKGLPLTRLGLVVWAHGEAHFAGSKFVPYFPFEHRQRKRIVFFGPKKVMLETSPKGSVSK